MVLRVFMEFFPLQRAKVPCIRGAGGSRIQWYIFVGDPDDKDYSILGSI